MDTRVVPKAEGRNPFTVVCYICGREFGSKSITIHEKQCMSKWEKANALLPRDQRRPKPRKPEAANGNDGIVVGGGKGDGVSAKDYNDAAFATFMEQGREECPHCGRKFLRDRLEIHLRSCKPGGHFAKEREKKAAATTASVDTLPKLPSKEATGTFGKSARLAKFCATCGQQFSDERSCPSCGAQRLKVVK